MIFIFKRKKIILDCFTYSDSVFNLYPIGKASNFFPEWFKKMPKEYPEKFYTQSTLKKCPGFIDNFKNGFIIPLWSDLSIIINENKTYEWQFADYKTKIDYHDPRQWNSFANNNDFFQMKIEGMWRIKTKNDIKFMWSNPFWNHPLNKGFEICPGVVDFKYQHGTNINLFLDYKPKKIFINHNTPMVHLFPLSEKEIVLKKHLISFDEFAYFSSINTFQDILKKTKIILNNKEKKCPFNF